MPEIPHCSRVNFTCWLNNQIQLYNSQFTTVNWMLNYFPQMKVTDDNIYGPSMWEKKKSKNFTCVLFHLYDFLFQKILQESQKKTTFCNVSRHRVVRALLINHMGVTFDVHHCDTNNSNFVTFLSSPIDNNKSKANNTQFWNFGKSTQYANEDKVSYKKFLQQKVHECS